MSKPLISASVAAPGFYGLNSQQSSVTLEDGFALEATNCIIDKYGRLGARKGYRILDNDFPSYARTADVDYIRLTGHTNQQTDGVFTIVFTSNHGYTVGETIEISYAQGLISGFYSLGTFVLDKGTDPSYTFNVTDSLTLTAVDPVLPTVPENLNGTVTSQWLNVVLIASPTFPTLYGMHRFVNITGTEQILVWGDPTQINPKAKGFYLYNNGQLNYPADNTSTNTFDDFNWQGATLNDKAFLFQEGYNPLVFNGTVFADITDSNCPEANTVLSAYGRLWAARTTTDKMTVYWSDLLDGENWSTGSAGSIDLSAIMVQGTDEIVGLGAQNGRLIVFTRRSIVIFGDSTGGSTLDPATLVLVEVINRVGCVARDSIQNTGTDIIFLSEDGLRSLGRVIQEKSLPMRDLSANIRDELVQAVASEDVNNIKSVYSEDNAFYLLLLPRYERIYCFDTRAPLPNGALRVTIWNNQRHTNMLSLPNDIYFTNPDGLCEYFGYQDNSASYPMLYLTNYFDLGSPTQTKILKKLTLTVIGLSSQDFVLKTAFDYIDSYRSYVGTLQALPGSEYNEAEYGLNDTVLSASQTSSTITVGTGEHYTADFQLEQDETYDVPLNLWLDDDTYYYSNDDGTRTQTTVYTQQGSYTYEYSVGTVSEPIRLSVGGAGSVLQVGFETTVDGSEFSIQKMDVYAKQGRVY